MHIFTFRTFFFPPHRYTGKNEIHCANPAFFNMETVSLSILIGNPAYLRISSPAALFTYVPRFQLTHVSPNAGSTAGGSTLRLTVTTRPIPLAVADLQCIFANERVPASIVAVEEQPIPDYDRVALSNALFGGLVSEENGTMPLVDESFRETEAPPTTITFNKSRVSVAQDFILHK